MARDKVDQGYVESVQRRTDISTVARRYTDIDGTGRGSCPFCEHGGTFAVRNIAGSGYYYCFSCQVAGGMFDLVKSMEGISFSDAVRLLGVE